MRTKLVQTKVTDPRINLALEEKLINDCQEGEVILYLWQNQNTVVIGRNQNPWRECRVEQMQQDGITLVRRNSGGGAVFHDLGNLNFTFIASTELYDLQKQLSVILLAVKRLGIEAEFSGRNDIVVNGQKFSGNAFSHNNRVSMQHGTLLVDVDMGKLGLYLNASVAKLESKGVKSVRSRVCNLKDLNPDLTIDILANEIISAFSEIYQAPEKLLRDEDLNQEEYRHLIEKFSSWEWTYGQTPQFNVTLENRFAWGEIQMHINSREGVITEAKLFSDAMDTEFIEKLTPYLIGAAYSSAEMAQALSFVPVTEDQQEKLEDLCQWIGSLSL